MDSYTATMIAEGQCGLAGIDETELTKEMYIEAWQRLVDSGLAWQLQGSFGRIAQQLINEGIINENKNGNN